MSKPQEALAQRIRELRRRHFGARGKAAFAERLALPVDEYERYERGVVPPGDVLMRICEVTGEDLQWLLTGLAARGTVVISGARGRHQDLIARLATLLDRYPELAAPIEAFVDLLARGKEQEPVAPRALPGPRLDDLVPIFDAEELPLALAELERSAADSFALAPYATALDSARRERAQFAEPATVYHAADLRTVEVVTLTEADRPARRCLCSPQLAKSMPGLFGVRLADDTMSPMFRAGDAVLVAVGAAATIGQPALCRIGNEPTPRCRIWLGPDDDVVTLGRLADSEIERIPADEIAWSLEVLYRLALAA